MSRRKPPALRVLEGTHRVDRHGAKPQKRHQTPLRRRPTCPTWLLPEAKAEWRRVMPEVGDSITMLNRSWLAAYCQITARVERLEAGDGAPAALYAQFRLFSNELRDLAADQPLLTAGNSNGSFSRLKEL